MAGMTIRSVGRRLLADRRGGAAVEFAMTMPILMMMILGGFDMVHSFYVQSVLEGEMAKAGRDGSLESSEDSSTQDAIDQRVRDLVQTISRDATVTFTRKSFSSYARVADPGEPFIDGNSNGICDAGEAYEDSNRNGTRDADGGTAGWGGAEDAVVYTATVTYPRIFPVGALMNAPNTITLSASTVLRIQPFTTTAAIPQGACP